MPEPTDLSDYVIYVDESGDHSLTSVDPAFPLFVLGMCIFPKKQYAEEFVPAVLRFKHEWFGHEAVVLHAHEIRKAAGEFRFLFKPEVRQRFLAGISRLMEAAPFTLIAAVIDKLRLSKSYQRPDNPYSLALGFCLERAFLFLNDRGQGNRLTPVIVEARGRKEDFELEAVFRRICDGANATGRRLPFDIRFADKKANLPGLQIADFVCQPIARNILNPAQPNQAYNIIEKKFRRDARGRKEGYGLKVFP